MKDFKYYLLVFIAITSLACASQKNTAIEPKSNPRTELKESQQNDRVSALFIDAGKERILGNLRQAMTLYQQCLSLDPKHAPSMYEMARMHRMQGNFNEAIALTERAVELDPDNKWYSLLLASLYEYTGQIKQAIAVFEKLNTQHPSELEFLHQIALLYLKENNFTKAITVYDKIEKISGADEEIIIQKQQLYLLSNQPEKAIAETEKLIRLFPDESRYYAMMAELYLELGNFAKAAENLEKIRELDPQNPYIHITLAEYYFKTGDYDRAYEELKTGFANPGLGLDIKFQVLLTYYSDDDIHGEYKAQVHELNEILIQTHPTDVRPYTLKADLLIREENYQEAREAFRKINSIDNSSFFIWETLLRIDAMLMDQQSLEKESLEAIGLFPLQPLPYLFAGLAAYQQDEYSKAISKFNSGKDLVVDDDELLSEFYMYLGDTYSKLEQHEASDAAYDQSLALNPDNPYVLNNYSYYLSLRKERLEFAEKMSARSLEISPGNKHYLDTYGWIMYQMGQYEEARKWIEKSVENNASADAVVLEHLGDVLYKLGKKTEALKYWKQALDMGGEISELLEKKVKDGTLYE